MSFPTPHIQPPAFQHTHTLLLLHGRASSGPLFSDDLLSSTPSLTAAFPSLRLVFPTATTQLSTVFQEDLTKWFDIYSLTTPDSRPELQISGLRKSVEYVLRLIDEEVELLGGDASKLIIGGISMGMATALVSMLVRGDNGKGGRLGGFVGASGWLPFAGVIQEEVGKEVGEVLTEKLGLDKTVEGREGELKGVPVFLGHGEDDAYVDFELGQKVRKVLEEKVGMKVVAKNYAGADEEGHWLKEPEEVEDIVEFLRGIVGEVEKEDGVAP